MIIIPQGGGYEVWLGNKSGKFTSGDGLSPNTQSSQCAVFGDVDGDHVPDLVMCSPFEIALGHANGTFTHPTKPALAYAATALALGDVDGDGTLDVVFPGARGIGAFRNLGAGTFEAPSPVAMGSTVYPGLADFDHDGHVDIATSEGALLDPSSGVLALGPFPPMELFDLGGIADFYGDGNADLALADRTSADIVQVVLGNGDDSFRAGSKRTGAFGVASLAIGDFTGDGRMDLAVGPGLAEDRITIFPGNGDGTFGTTSVFFTTDELSPFDMFAGDFDRDGITDLVVGDRNGTSLYRATGGGAFTQTSTLSTALVPALVADLDGDGNLDVVATDETTTTSIFMGHGDGTFAAPFVHDFARPPERHGARCGRRRHARSGLSRRRQFSVSLGHGDFGTFRRPHTYAVLFSRDGSFPGIASVDVDHDGHTDVVVPEALARQGVCLTP